MMHRVRYKCRTGFTLVELLVVMAVVAVFLGVLGLAISSSGGAMGTQAAQRTVTTMVSAARSQAVTAQSRTRLIIHVDPPTAGDMSDPRREKFLRFMAILVEDEPNVWKEINDGTYLPKGTYVVPPWTLDAPAPTISANIISGSPSDWKHERRTIVERQTMQYAYGDPTGTAPPNHYIYIEFDPRGTTIPITRIGGLDYERRIVFAPAKTTGIFPHFGSNQDLEVLGGVIRRNGSFTLINDPAGFPEQLP